MLFGVSYNFDMSFGADFCLYYMSSSALSFTKLQLHETQAVKNVFMQEKLVLWLTFNPGLALTGFRTTPQTNATA